MTSVPAIAATLLFTLSVIFTFVNAVLFLDERLTVMTVLGAALIIAGVVLRSTGKSDTWRY